MGKTNSKSLWAAAGFLALAGLLAAAFLLLRPDASAGAKTISVVVATEQDAGKTHTIQTDAAYLRQALEENDLIAGEDGEFGLFVQTVDGVTADAGNQEWWCFTKDGQQLFTGVDDTPIADGDSFEITLTTGW